jgi:hypothetical protein
MMTRMVERLVSAMHSANPVSSMSKASWHHGVGVIDFYSLTGSL